METKIKIRNFLSRFFRGGNLQDDDDIFSLGFFNSLFAMQLVLFLEEEFDIIVDNIDLDLDKFRTINRMEELIREKRAPGAKA
jgi:methoxymalonate biosynthesis acyl carrier protein